MEGLLGGDSHPSRPLFFFSMGTGRIFIARDLSQKYPYFISDTQISESSVSIKIILAVHHEKMRQSLRSIMAGQKGLSIVGEVTDDSVISNLARESSADLILFDMEMPVLSNLEVIRRLHSEIPDIKVLALAIHSDKRFVRETLKAGAAGYLLKYLAHEELLEAVNQVMEQGSYLSSGLEGTEPVQTSKDHLTIKKNYPPKKEVIMPYK